MQKTALPNRKSRFFIRGKSRPYRRLHIVTVFNCSVILLLFRSVTTNGVYHFLNVIRLSGYCLTDEDIPTFELVNRQTNSNANTDKNARYHCGENVLLFHYAVAFADVSIYAQYQNGNTDDRIYVFGRLLFSNVKT